MIVVIANYCADNDGFTEKIDQPISDILGLGIGDSRLAQIEAYIGSAKQWTQNFR